MGRQGSTPTTSASLSLIVHALSPGSQANCADTTFTFARSRPETEYVGTVRRLTGRCPRILRVERYGRRPGDVRCREKRAARRCYTQPCPREPRQPDT